MKSKLTLKTFALAVLIIQLLAFQLPPMAAAQAERAQRAFTVNVGANGPAFVSPSVYVGGTGNISVSGSLNIASGCCARVKVELVRVAIPPIPAGVQKEETFEICGTRQVAFSDNLSATEDDRRFAIRVSNVDPWNRVAITGNLTLSYPTGRRNLPVQPSVPITLNQGQDETRTFILIPNLPGHLKIEMTWQGAATLRARLFKSGQTANPQSGGIANQTSSAQPLIIEKDLTAADLTDGPLDRFSINVLNASQTSVTASSITIRVTFTPIQ